MYASYHQHQLSQSHFDSQSQHRIDMSHNQENHFRYYTPIKPRSPIPVKIENIAMASSSSENSQIYSDNKLIVKPQKKRGRKPKVPSEDQELSRRLKKQDLERKRRASISDKMSAIHKLTKQLLGDEDNDIQHTEKADILNLCHNVLKGIANVMETEPTLAERVKSEWNECIKINHTEPSAEQFKKSRKRSSNSTSTNDENSNPMVTPLKILTHSTPYRTSAESTASNSGTSASNTSPWTSHSASSYYSSYKTSSSGVASSNSVLSNGSGLVDVWRPYL